MSYEKPIVPIKVLLVEDNPGDARLTMMAMHECKIKVTVDNVTDGEQALDYLNKEGSYTSATRPDIILLDLNLPKKNGFDVLKVIKEDEELRRIPVAVLTTSKAEEDILRSYNLYANCFISKPIDFEQFTKVVKSIEDFWFTIVKLPDGEK
jgi:two-component system, chemotaxis family, response regulator Rcp1